MPVMAEHPPQAPAVLLAFVERLGYQAEDQAWQHSQQDVAMHLCARGNPTG